MTDRGHDGHDETKLSSPPMNHYLVLMVITIDDPLDLMV